MLAFRHGGIQVSSQTVALVAGCGKWARPLVYVSEQESKGEVVPGGRALVRLEAVQNDVMCLFVGDLRCQKCVGPGALCGEPELWKAACFRCPMSINCPSFSPHTKRIY